MSPSTATHHNSLTTPNRHTDASHHRSLNAMGTHSTIGKISAALLTLLIACILGISTARANPISVGTQIAPITLKDQFNQDISLTHQTQWLLFSHQKAINSLISAHLSTLGQSRMNAQGIVYFADISAMPSMITRLFAMPKMKKLNFSIGLSNEAARLAHIPRKDQHATLIRIKHGTIQSIDYAATSAQLQQRLSQP